MDYRLSAFPKRSIWIIWNDKKFRGPAAALWSEARAGCHRTPRQALAWCAKTQGSEAKRGVFVSLKTDFAEARAEALAAAGRM